MRPGETPWSRCVDGPHRRCYRGARLSVLERTRGRAVAFCDGRFVGLYASVHLSKRAAERAAVKAVEERERANVVGAVAAAGAHPARPRFRPSRAG